MTISNSSWSHSGNSRYSDDLLHLHLTDSCAPLSWELIWVAADTMIQLKVRLLVFRDDGQGADSNRQC